MSLFRIGQSQAKMDGQIGSKIRPALSADRASAGDLRPLETAGGLPVQLWLPTRRWTAELVDGLRDIVRGQR